MIRIGFIALAEGIDGDGTWNLLGRLPQDISSLQV